MTYDPERKDWSILTITAKGVISLLRELSLAEAEKIYERLLLGYNKYEITYDLPDNKTYTNYVYHGYINEINKIEVLGPEGWNADIVISVWAYKWPKYKRLTVDDPNNHLAKAYLKNPEEFKKDYHYRHLYREEPKPIEPIKIKSSWWTGRKD